ncbi:MAG: hypothetical protein IJH18_02115 [Bacilli bacterium]|nr:hypothetical protein [Bacilli bacterium]
MPSGFYGDTHKKKKSNKKAATKLKKVNTNVPKLEKVKKVKTSKKKEKSPKKIVNIICLVIVVLVVLSAIDYVLVSKYEKGPFFAIKTKTHSDGGTKEYYGLFYKVIKYDQSIGRKDIEVGSWGLKYYVEPIDYSALDLALDLNNKPKETYKKISKKFMRINGEVLEGNDLNNELTLHYKDPDGDYTLNIVCKMWSSNALVSDYIKGEYVTVLGTVTKFEMKSKRKPNTLTLKNCFGS